MESGFPENTFVFLMVIGILIMLSLALAFVLFFNSFQKKVMKEQMLNQKQAFKYQEDLLHSTIMTQEEERKRIARDLHDEIGSKLNIIFLNMHRMKEFSKENEEMTSIAEEMKSLIHTTINTTRRISHDLLPPALEDFGLIEAIKELRDTLLQSKIVSIDFNLVEKEKEIDDVLIELNLFRVIQELINNSIRHGKATEIGLNMWVKKSLIKLEYVDNGEGFDMTQFEHKKGLGMKNIESRLSMIQASFQYDSSLGKGMKMEIERLNQEKNGSLTIFAILGKK